ncbi:N-acetylmuramic acid/N-acetylglucosamine kinase [Sporomusaceae bacterium FL31]|nr:N-acetylmuramic acid/N-acetylglucosamine kinase [Sporomusaceae bacterium FL31]GCE33024.1 N-acetylmuramic acid/N-acetylglucosamine kinase [Sporomusaceae bacterium]
MKEAIVLAIDGGGTGCRAALCNRVGQLLAYAQGDSCNYHSIGVERATENLLVLLTTLVKKQALHMNCVVLGLAGLDTKKDEAVLTLMVDQALAAANITADSVYLCNDAMLTLKGSVGQNNGVLLAAGTGSIACGFTKEGLETRVGGWGYRVGDEGSGYSIGKAAIAHVLKSYDGREKYSDISAAILKQLALSDEDALINWVYSSHFSVTQVAALTPIIVNLAETGDCQAQQIIQCACQELEIMVLTVIRKLGLLNAEFSLVLSGGVLKNQLVHRQLIQHLASTCPGLQLIDLNYQPICAILRHGLIMMGYDNNTLLNQLSRQLTTLINRPES